MLLIVLISLLVWLICGLIGYAVLMDQYYDLFKIGWDNQKKFKYSAKILLGPIFMILAIAEYKSTKIYWHSISHKQRTGKEQHY